MDADLNHVTLTGVLERGPNTRCADHGAQPVSAGMNIRAIARQLTMERIPTKIDRHKTSGHKQYGEGRWCVPSIHHILRNETYVGTMYWNKRQRITKTRLQKRDRSEWLAIPVPVIISPGLFEAVQQKIAHNRALSKRNRKHEYLLLRGRLRCGRWS